MSNTFIKKISEGLELVVEQDESSVTVSTVISGRKTEHFKIKIKTERGFREMYDTKARIDHVLELTEVDK